jgi:hypothetical protein
VALFDCRDASWDCGWCDRAGACVLFPDGGLVPDAGGGACAPFAGQRICSVDRVCWEHPLPQGNDLVAVWGTASSGPNASIWAVGAAGTVLHYDGNAWSNVDSGTRNDLLAVWSDQANEAWVAGVSGTWSKVTLQGTVTPVANVAFNDITDLWGDPSGPFLWAVGYGGKVYRLNRASLPPTAAPLAIPGASIPLYAVFGVSGGATVWAAGANGAYSYTAATGSYTPGGSVLAYDAFDLWMPSALQLFVSASDGGVYSSNGVTSWSPQPLAPPLGDIPAAIWGNAATGELWVRGYDGLSYYRSPSPSLTWSSSPDPSRLNFRDVWGDSQVWSVGEKGYLGTWNASNAQWDARSTAVFPPRSLDAGVLALQQVGCEAWAGGRNGQLLHRAAAGWSERLRAPAPITSLWAPNPSELWYAFGDAGQVGRIIGGGFPVEYLTKLDTAVGGLSGLGPSAVWAVGEDGGIAYWDGMGWGRQANPQRANLNAVLALAPDDVWAAGNAQTVLHFNGGAWITITAPGSGLDLRAIAASGSKVFFAGGTTLFTYDRDAGWSSRSDAPRPLSALAVDAQGRLWAAGTKGALGYVPADGSAFRTVEALTPGDLHALSFLGGVLVVAGDENAILDVHPGP